MNASLKIGISYVSFGTYSLDNACSAARGARGSVDHFSPKSRSRLARYLGNCSAHYRYMGTLTYGCVWPTDGVQVKAQFDRFLKFMLRRMRDVSNNPDAESICWFIEFQERGAPHFHFFYTTRLSWKELARYWAECAEDPGIWGTSTRFERLRRGRNGTVGYARKYASKLAQKVVPDDYKSVGRFWGVRGYRGIVAATTTFEVNEGTSRVATMIRRTLDRLVDERLLRRFPWSYGCGYVYVAADGGSVPAWLRELLQDRVDNRDAEYEHDVFAVDWPLG